MAKKKKKKKNILKRAGVIPFIKIKNELMIMLITARNTPGTCWITPKGKIDADLTAAESAELEAFEEAGIYGHLYEQICDSFTFVKRDQYVKVFLYPFKISHILSSQDWIESDERRRTLVPLYKAIHMVAYPGLAGLLHRYANHLKQLAELD